MRSGSVSLILVSAIVIEGWIPGTEVAAENLWTVVARAPELEVARERRRAQFEAQAHAGVGRTGKGSTALATGEARLRRVLDAFPADFEARRQLAELLSATGRPRDAVRALEVARRVAPAPVDEARIWFRIAGERSRLGAYDDALDAYMRQLALGDVDPVALANTAELLMAQGRLDEAIDRYHEALVLEESDPDRRGHIQELALGSFGLAVALDRANRPIAAREAMGRALSLDAGLAVLRLAEQGNGDLFLIPPGDVFYYLGLAREQQGRPEDAAAAFRDYLRVATGRYSGRARDHLARLASRPATDEGDGRPPTRSRSASSAPPPPSSGAARGIRLRVIHEVTLVADGPLVAPLIDAAWRLDRGLLDACLSDVVLTGGAFGDEPAPPAREFRLSLELDIDEGGRVKRARVEPSNKSPAGQSHAGLGAVVTSCIENAVETRFRVSRPARRRPTRARIELVLAPAEPGGV